MSVKSLAVSLAAMFVSRASVAYAPARPLAPNIQNLEAEAW